MEKNRITSWLAKFSLALMALCVITACSKGDDDNGGNSGGLTPDPNIPTVSNVKYELAPAATIVPEATAKQITAVDTISHKFTLPISAGKPEVGHTLIINTPTKELHDGLLAKVISVSETSKSYVVNYENAELKQRYQYHEDYSAREGLEIRQQQIGVDTENDHRLGHALRHAECQL